MANGSQRFWVLVRIPVQDYDVHSLAHIEGGRMTDAANCEEAARGAGWFLALVVSLLKVVALATTALPAAQSAHGSDVLPSGVVVEAVQRGFAAERAGVQAGDVLESWSQANSAGSERQEQITSPLVLADLEFGQLTRGPVVLHGARAGAPVRIEVSPDAVGMGVTLRPRFPQALLDLYLRGRELIAAGRAEQGASLWREAAVRARRIEGGKAAGCWLLAQVGTAWAVARQAEPAREAFDDAVSCAESGDGRWVATLLEWQADQEFELGAPEVTATALETAFALRDAHPAADALSSIECLFNLVVTQRARGRTREAHAILLYMLEVAERQAPDSLLVSRVLLQIGRSQRQSGDLELAETTTLRAAEIADRANPRSSTWARAQMSLGELAGSRGDLATMEDLYRRAVDYHLRYSPDSLEAGRALLNLGTVATVRGDLAAARDWEQAALRVLEPMPNVRNIRAAALSNLGVAALLQGNIDQALAAFERAAADIYATAAGSFMVPEIELNLSRALSARGDLERARAHADTALEAAERLVPRSLTMAATLVVRGELARREGDWDAAEECFARSLETLDELDVDHLLATHALQGLAAVLRFRGDAQAAERHLRRAVAMFEANRGRVGRSDEERSLFISSFHGVYRDLIDLLAQQGRMAEAFEVLESSRARSFLSMLAARDLRFDLDVPPERERERRAVGAAYERAQQRLAQVPAGAAETEALRGKLTELRERQLQLDLEIRQASPRLAALREPQPLDAAGVASHLEPGTLLIAYSIGAERTVAFSLAGGPDGGVQAVLIPAGEEELRRRIGAWRALAQASPPGPRFRSEARRLYALLLAPLAERLRKAQRVIISADGPLHALPFAALKDERGFLAERKALAFVPSGTVYAQQAMARAPRRWGAPAAFGDPRYGSGTFPPLPGSRREVSAVATIFPDTRTYVGRQATEETVKALDREGRFVHFAVHGVVDQRAPLDSALVLSTAATEEDRDNGLLHAWEIFERVRLDADLVALSACGSAAGADRPGEGIIGLTRAFLYAGARSVLASLWNVGDASTGAFMRTFYEGWSRGVSKAEALRRAQVDAIRRGQRPLRWAAFQLYGDDR